MTTTTTPDETPLPYGMSRREAHALLDAVKGGADVPAWAITRALNVTGDLPLSGFGRTPTWGLQ